MRRDNRSRAQKRRRFAESATGRDLDVSLDHAWRRFAEDDR